MLDEQVVNYYKSLEDEISKMPQEVREMLYRPCAIACVKDEVLAEQKRQFEECHGDMDLIYKKYASGEGYFRRIIESGRIYEMGYPNCVCYLNRSGCLESAGHCECSRQSIIYILHELAPEMKFKVEIVDTVLAGAKECTFRIMIEDGGEAS